MIETVFNCDVYYHLYIHDDDKTKKTQQLHISLNICNVQIKL